jgi:predicted PurR-regulated permease PerM
MGENLFERAVALGVLALLLLFCLQIALPFIGPLLWGIVLAVATWPAYARLARALGGRRRLSATLMALAMVVVFIVPISMIAVSLADQVGAAASMLYDLTAYGLPPPPRWVAGIPLVGDALEEEWRRAMLNAGATLAQLRPYITAAAGWILARGAGIGYGILEFLLAVLIAGVLFANAEACLDYLHRFVRRIGGEASLGLVELAGQTIRGVANGVVGTALIQAALAGVAFVVAGVPGAGVLLMAVFLISLIQLTPVIIVLLVALWQYFQGEIGWSIFMALWGLLVVGTVDNLVRPYLISQGAKLPLVIIFIGVIGGLLAYGFLGIFLGAVILAVVWRMAVDWLKPAEESGRAGGG